MTFSTIRPEWSALFIGLMILGFIVFWPLGLVMLAYILWGEKFAGSADRAEEKWMKFKSKTKNSCMNIRRKTPTGNAAFDAYLKQELERLQEERRKLDEERQEFEDYIKMLRSERDRQRV